MGMVVVGFFCLAAGFFIGVFMSHARRERCDCDFCAHSWGED